MKKIIASICLLLLTCFMVSNLAHGASSREDLQARIDASKIVLDEILNANDKSLP